MVCVTLDHPHAYGDKNTLYNKSVVKEGSSPRVWGQVNNFIAEYNKTRIIPTRMGTRSLFDNRKSWNKDHPHAYGDKLSTIIICEHRIGSSPRVWGQADKNEALTMQNGIIPTRMGTRATYKVIAVCYWDHPHAYGDKYETSLQSRSIDGSSPRVWGQVQALVGTRA